uniref:Uncharacterized protein n=1 Tax=Anguilla anguilla TaxID=7936 RepID=A0A0E9XKE6_ANGAN
MVKSHRRHSSVRDSKWRLRFNVCLKYRVHYPVFSVLKAGFQLLLFLRENGLIPNRALWTWITDWRTLMAYFRGPVSP